MKPLSIGVVIAALAAFAPIVYKLIDFVKLVLSGDRSTIAAQAAAFVVGVVVAFCVVHSDFARGTALEHLNIYTVIIAGLSLGATGSTVYDFKRAFDRNDSASMPRFLPGAAYARQPRRKRTSTSKTRA